MSAGEVGVQRKRWALVAAIVVVALVIGVVVAFGLIPYPDLPSVADQPDPPVTAQLAYTSYERAGPCVHVVDGRGRDRELGCGQSFQGVPVWLEDGRLGLRSYEPDGSTVAVLQTDTGEVIERVEELRTERQDLQVTNEAGEELRIGGQDGRTWVQVTGPDGDGRRVLELDGPGTYQLYEVGWSTDGDWIVAQDSIGRVLVVAADGRVEARIWATDVGSVAVS
ncbi:MAG TPA: hypothetical protein VMM13_11445 [Euzebya sp.]|nr:hypothetical protein [Euzebya sp.]